MTATRVDRSNIRRELRSLLHTVRSVRTSRSDFRDDPAWTLDTPADVQALVNDLISRSSGLSNSEADEVRRGINNSLERLSPDFTVAGLERLLESRIRAITISNIDSILEDIADARDRINIATEELEDAIERIKEIRETFGYLAIAIDIAGAIVSASSGNLGSLFRIVDAIP